MAIASGAMLSGTTLQQLNKSLPQIISLVLVVACGYTLAQFSWQIYNQLQQQPPAAAPITTPAKSSRALSSRQKVAAITNSNLFGKASQRSAIAPSKAPITRLNLVLRGVLAADSPSIASAIIASGKGGKEEIYGIGDKIQNGVKLSEIHKEHVIIDRQGKLEKLAMEKSRGNTTGTAVRASSNNSQTSSNPTSLRDIRNDIIRNPTSFGEYALPVVVKENGKQVGYRLKPQKKGGLLAKSGIQPSDVITEINGVKLDNPQNGIKALRELSSANSVNLTVKRGQSFVPLNIQLQ